MTWPSKRLEEVCQTTSGGTPSRARPEYFGGSIPWIKSGDLTDGLVSRCEENITEAGLRSSSAKLFPMGTLLVAMYGATVGKLGILSIDAATNQAICGITPSRALDSKFLFYFLLSQRKSLIDKSTGGAQPNISQRIIRELQVPVPPGPDQLHIVDLLSRAEGIVSLRRQAQQKAAELIPAIFADMFGDPATNPKGLAVVTLGEVLASAEYGSSSKASDADVGLPMIRMGNVDYSGNIDLTDLKFVELPADDVVRFGLKDGDILFNRTNSKELVGKTGLWTGDRQAILASYFIRLRVLEQTARPFFVWAFMNTPHMKRVLFETARGAIGQANINSRELRAFRIPLPGLDEQARFESRCRDVLALRSQQRHAMTKAEAAFQASLARAFSVTSQGAMGRAQEEATA